MNLASAVRRLDAAADAVLPTAARLVFAGVLFRYYWASAMTKVEGVGGLLSPTAGAYVQIFPRAMEAAGYDPSRLSALHHLVVLAGTWAEFLLPVAIVVGLLTRLAALGMIGFIVVQSVVDVTGHGLDPGAVGAWFDRIPDATLLDQRAFWVFLLLVLAMRGGGPISLDRLIIGRVAPQFIRVRQSSD